MTESTWPAQSVMGYTMPCPKCKGTGHLLLSVVAIPVPCDGCWMGTGKVGLDTAIFAGDGPHGITQDDLSDDEWKEQRP